MTGKIEARLKSLGLELPPATKPAGNYVPFVITGSLVFISGQVSVGPDGIEYKGKAGRDLDLDEATKAARQCGLNIITQLNQALEGDLDRVTRCVKLVGFVSSTPEFTQQPAVINGASDLMVEIFADAGRHTRSSVGAPSLPLDFAVEIEAIFEIGLPGASS